MLTSQARPVAANAILAAMDDLEWIRKGLAKPGKTQRGLANALGIDAAGVTRLLKGDRQLKAAEVDRVKRYLDENPPARSDVDLSRQLPVADGPRDLPIYGSVKGSFVGEAVDAIDPVEWKVRPHSLIGVTGAFGLYVVGTSMEPRYHQGEIVYVHPGRPRGCGAYVVILLTDDTAILKKLLRENSDFWEVEQLNPPEKLKLPAAKVAKVYRVTGSEER
jgi:phage repressor protein C with HTH and peptisase S24 domain